jgi:hypothetical protein
MLHWGEGSGCENERYFTRLGPISRELVLSTSGGLEATQYMGHFTLKQMMLRGKGSYAEALLYVDSIGDTVNYILNWGTPHGILIPNNGFGSYDPDLPLGKRGDVAEYWFKMAYLNLERLKQKYSLKEISDKHLWNGPNFSFGILQFGALYTSALNPAFLYSAYKVGDYIATGKTSFPMPRFLPFTNFVLGPEGPDFYLGLLARYGEENPVLSDSYVRMTGTYEEKAYGTGFGLTGRYKNWLTWRVGGDGWKQSSGWGGGFRVGGDFRIPGTPIILGANFSCKTHGYSFGQPADPGCSAAFRFGI